jgi:hypothetical protein
MEPRKIRGAADARACLAAAAESGQARAAWARAHHVNARSLNAWRLNLLRLNGRPPQPIRLVELVADDAPARTRYRVRCGPFEVAVDGLIEEERLAQLLRAMAAAC